MLDKLTIYEAMELMGINSLEELMKRLDEELQKQIDAYSKMEAQHEYERRSRFQSEEDS